MRTLLQSKHNPDEAYQIFLVALGAFFIMPETAVLVLVQGITINLINS